MGVNSPHTVSRRNFLRTAAVATGTVGAAQLAPTAQSQSSQPKPGPVEMELPPLPFVHGVASGDPLPDAVVIWTRITPDEDAMPGSGGGTNTRVRWQVARDAQLRNIVAEGETESRVERDHTIHVDVPGLSSRNVMRAGSSCLSTARWLASVSVRKKRAE